jgi:hypothetical protein
MKHLTLSLLCAGLVALASCNKEKTIQPAQPATESGQSISNSVKKEKKPKWFHANYDKKDGYCKGWYGNCVVVTTIIVKPHALVLINEAGSSGSSEAVAVAFRHTELSDVVKYCLTEDGYAARLQSGNYYIAKTGDDGKEACYISGTQYPVTAENMEFAFQFAYGEIGE